MKHFRIKKLAKPGGALIKNKDVLAAMRNRRWSVRSDDDCPVREVYEAGKRVGSVEERQPISPSVHTD